MPDIGRRNRFENAVEGEVNATKNRRYKKINMNRLTPDISEFLTEEIISLLNLKELYTAIDFVNCDPQRITKITRLPFRDVIIIRRKILNKYSAREKNAYDYYKLLLKNSAIISTGIQGLDLILDGGFLTGNIVELCGLAASGKTQLCLNLVKHISRDLKQDVYYFDTKGDFSAKRIRNMMNGDSKEDIIANLSRILVKKIKSKYDLCNSLYEIKDILFKTSNFNARIIIIDSLLALFLENGDQSENNGYLNHIVSIMRFICLEYHMVILITNLVTTWNEGDFTNIQTSKETTSLGKYWYGIPNTRLKITKDVSKDDIYIINLLKRGANLELSDANVRVSFTHNGILEYTE